MQEICNVYILDNIGLWYWIHESWIQHRYINTWYYHGYTKINNTDTRIGFDSIISIIVEEYPKEFNLIL